MRKLSIAARREFLVNGLGLLGVGTALPNFLVRTALAGPQSKQDESILVVVQLSGGHDGLSAVVPYSNEDYIRNRHQTRITAEEVLKINDEVGLHPNLKGLKAMYDQGSMAIVQGVGYPNANRSHFKSMDIWHDADNSGKAQSYGWLGRYCDRAFPGVTDPKLAIAIGSNQAPKAIQGGEHPGISLERPDAYRFMGENRNRQVGAAYRQLSQMKTGEASENLDFVSQTTVNANSSSQEILKLAASRTDKPAYPTSRLASALSIVGSLIAGGLSTRVFYVSQGGFDTHRDQRGRHDRLMTELSEGVSAFYADLKQQGNAQRVVTISFSEFGRRVKENASDGTDHGKAGPMFMFGPGVKPGVHGKLPSLADDALDAGDVKHEVDFRSVYAAVLEKWLGCPSEPVLLQKFPLLDCLA